MIDKGAPKDIHTRLKGWLEGANRDLVERNGLFPGEQGGYAAGFSHRHYLDECRHAAVDALEAVVDRHGPSSHPKPICLQCSSRSGGVRVAFPCHTYLRILSRTVNAEGTSASRPREMTPRRVQPPFGEDLAVQRSECGDLVFNDGVRWGAELFPDREFLAAERKRFDLVDELMRSEEIARDEQTRAIAQAMFGAPFEGLTGPQRAAAEEATRRAEELSETGGADL